MSSLNRLISDFLISLSKTLSADEGQGLAEYGLILGLIAVLCIGAVLFLSGNIQSLLSNVGNGI